MSCTGVAELSGGQDREDHLGLRVENVNTGNAIVFLTSCVSASLQSQFEFLLDFCCLPRIHVSWSVTWASREAHALFTPSSM